MCFSILLAGREYITCVYTLPSLLYGHPAPSQADLCRGTIAQRLVFQRTAKLAVSLQTMKVPIRKNAAHHFGTHVRKTMLRPAHACDHTCRAHVLFPRGCLPSHVWWQAAAEDARHHQEPVPRRPDCSSARSSYTCSSSSTAAGPLPCTWCGPSTRAGSPTGGCRMSLTESEPPVFQCCADCLRVLVNACTSPLAKIMMLCEVDQSQAQQHEGCE